MSLENKAERNELEAMVVAMCQGQELGKAILRRMQERRCTMADFHRLLSEETGPWLIEQLIDAVRGERTCHLGRLKRWSKAFTAADLTGQVEFNDYILNGWHNWSGKGTYPLDHLRGPAYTQPPAFSGMLKWCPRDFTVRQALELGLKMVDRHAPLGYHTATATDAISAAIALRAKDRNAEFSFIALGTTHVSVDDRDAAYLVVHSQAGGLPRLSLGCMDADHVIQRDLDVLYVKNMPGRPVHL